MRLVLHLLDRALSIGLATTTLIASCASLVFAQNTAQLPLQFDFLPPGARSVGMGSAFIAAADDATAAFTNPAGLARLARREISAELRFKRLETPFLFGGRITGAVTNVGLDTVPNPVYGQDVDDQFGPAFVSFLWPIGTKASVIGYRHEVATIENTYFSQGVFERVTELGVTDDRTRTTPVGGTRAVRIRNYGGSVGYKVSERFSIGGGIALYRFRLEADFARFGIEGNFASLPNRNLITATATQRGEDWTAGFNAGALFDVTPKVKVGATYRRGPAFTFSQEDLVPSIDFELFRVGKFKVPDVFGLGLEWRATDVLRVVVDYDRIQYAQLLDDFIKFQSLISKRPERMVLDDGNELHVGAEYLLPNAPIPLALRAGFWHDPDHVVRYDPTPAMDDIDKFFVATLPGGESQAHYTFGAGLAPTRWLELNGAADLAAKTKYVTFSVVIRY
ncbi:MAG TPA: outer membrane protein transport protein [Vicinamibacterales bacterium]|nr:outer membrane protein transport protein [Vicinamibacterales bacterium]